MYLDTSYFTPGLSVKPLTLSEYVYTQRRFCWKTNAKIDFPWSEKVMRRIMWKQKYEKDLTQRQLISYFWNNSWEKHEKDLMYGFASLSYLNKNIVDIHPIFPLEEIEGIEFSLRNGYESKGWQNVLIRYGPSDLLSILGIK